MPEVSTAPATDHVAITKSVGSSLSEAAPVPEPWTPQPLATRRTFLAFSGTLNATVVRIEAINNNSPSSSSDTVCKFCFPVPPVGAPKLSLPFVLR